MIRIGSAAHAKVQGPVDEGREIAAAAEMIPSLWRKTQQSSWYRLLSVPRWMYRGYTRSNAGDLAASIAYHALIAMVPMFFLLVGVGGLFLKSDAVLHQAVEIIQTVFPAGTGSRDAFEAALDARRNSGLISLVSLMGFAWAGTGLISSMARGMNRVYGVRNASYVKEKQRGFVVIFLFLLFFFIATLASIAPTVLLQRNLPEALDKWLLSTRFNQIVAYLVAFFSAVMLFLVIYRIVPNARQRLLDVVPGTLAAGLLFVLLTQSFPIYIELVGGVNRYGQLLGLISLIVATLYFLAHIILFGSYINATWQRYRERKRQMKRAEKAGANELGATA
ncbi:MAG TPA: YihY/virulence factor BrkB family protein [Thermomicrobiales bacterium]|nr:YihY/virulence factor BrkB family protein [Thermomicrobiales bacterium]